MLDALLDGLIDTIKLIPFLFVTFIILEYLEHKISKKNQKILTKNKKLGPLFGGILGAVPQCGFSSMAANLFSARVITIGTLVAVFLSTSDEMLPIMIGQKTAIKELLLIVGFKVLVGIIVGFIVDLIYKRKEADEHEHIEEICEHEHCHCKSDEIFLSSVKHTLKITLFILIANLAINMIIFLVGEDNLSKVLLNKNIFVYFIASLIGLIPNCASSVIMTELYLSKIVSLGTLMSGLITGSGIGILLLFKQNKNIKENLSILSIIYFEGVIVGILEDIVM